VRAIGRTLLPWALALLFAALSGFLLSRIFAGRAETRRAEAAPVVTAIRRIAQLATVEVQISDVLRFEEVKSFLVFDFPKSATLRMRGRAIGGFDLSSPEFRVSAEPDRRMVRVSLPPPRILALDPRLEWFDEKSGILNPITPQDRTRWMLWARGQLARAARQSGIADRAVEHARQLFSGAAGAFGWQAAVTIGSSAAPPTP
jgi:hypothetical protein